jgi:hypothetical protein
MLPLQTNLNIYVYLRLPIIVTLLLTVVTYIQAGKTFDAMKARLQYMSPLLTQSITAHIQLNVGGGLVTSQTQQELSKRVKVCSICK